jgi:hypothetical protein
MINFTKPKFVNCIDITFLLPSIKDYNSFGRRVVDSIYERQSDKSFEIIVCHPTHIDDNRIRYIPDNKLIGTAYALNHCSKLARGDVISVVVDDHILTKNPFGLYDFLQSDHFKDRKYKITTFPGGYSNVVSYSGGIPDNNSTLSLALKKLDCFTVIPRFPVMCYPIVHKETLVKHLNYNIFHPTLKYLGDVWLGAFLNFNNEPGIQYNDCWSKSIGGTEEGMLFDHILGRTARKFERESLFNLHRLYKNYKPGNDYDYGKSLFLTDEQILECM